MYDLYNSFTRNRDAHRPRSLFFVQKPQQSAAAESLQPQSAIAPAHVGKRDHSVRVWAAFLGACALVLGSLAHGATRVDSSAPLALLGVADTTGLTAFQLRQLTEHKFPGIVNANIAQGGDVRLSRLSNDELVGLSITYLRITGNIAELERTVAAYAPGNFARFQTAAKIAALQLSMPGIYGGPAPPAPTLDNTLYENYLEFRTAEVGSMSVKASLIETSAYAMRWLAAAYGVGTLIGDGIHWLIEAYAPQFDDVIGASLDGALQTIGLATNDSAAGGGELQLINDFSNPNLDATGVDCGDYGSLGCADLRAEDY